MAFRHGTVSYTHLDVYKRQPMGKVLRGREWEATKEFLEGIGIPTLGRIEPPGKMEGGDVLWIDEKTVAIGRGYRTNDEGIRQFKELTKDFIDEYIICLLYTSRCV